MDGLLPWNGGWRNSYADAAKALGYICAWGGAKQLNIFRGDGVFLSSQKPSGKFFSMADVVKQAERDGAGRIRALEEKAREKEERFIEYCSRSAAGEPLRMIWKARKEAREREGRLPTRSGGIMLAAAMLGYSAWGMGGRRGF